MINMDEDNSVLRFSWVTDVLSLVNLYIPDRIAKELNGLKPTKYLTINSQIIYPSERDLGFKVKPVNHEPLSTKPSSVLDLSERREGDQLLVSLVYEFKGFFSKDTIQNPSNNSLDSSRRIIDIKDNELEDLLYLSKKEFSKKLSPFGIDLNPHKTYLRFSSY